jgi:hypothetical protein
VLKMTAASPRHARIDSYETRAQRNHSQDVDVRSALPCGRQPTDCQQRESQDVAPVAVHPQDEHGAPGGQSPALALPVQLDHEKQSSEKDERICLRSNGRIAYRQQGRDHDAAQRQNAFVGVLPVGACDREEACRRQRGEGQGDNSSGARE